MTDPTDEELMVRVQHGDAAAFTTLFERHRVPLHGYVLRMTRDPETAADIFQETFLRVHRARATWTSTEASFRSWLYRIATNALRDRHRHAQRRPESLVETEPFGVTRDHPAERMMLERALDALPEPMREAFVLGAVHGLDHHELAAALDCTPDTARARLSRARARLRELLEEA